MLERAYDHSSWHGPNLRGSIRGVTPMLAAWRPAPGRHNIWELIVHSAYWKYVARDRMTEGEHRATFPLGGHNWYARPSRPVEVGVYAPDGTGLQVPSDVSERGRRAPLLADRSPARQLRNDIALLEAEHRALLDLVRNMPPRLLHKKIGKGQHTYLSTIAGVAAHDIYHAGQIQLLKAFWRTVQRRKPSHP